MNKTVTVRFDKDHDYDVYRARVEWGLPVRANQIIKHPMVGRVVYINHTRYFVESAHKHWSRGYYVILMLNNFSNSHSQIYFETLGPCYDEQVMEYIAKDRAKTVFTHEALDETAKKKIEYVYKIGQFLYAELVRKKRGFKEELEMVEKAGLVNA